MSRKSPLKPVKKAYPVVRRGSQRPLRAATNGVPPDGAPAPERVPYVRVRLPKKNTSSGAPWRYFYLVPTRALPAFVRRGIAHLSYLVTVTIEGTDLKVNGHKVGESGHAEALFGAADVVHLVVPLRRAADVVPHVTRRKSKAQKDEPWSEYDIMQMQSIVPKEVTLHTSAGSQRLCTACRFFHMMELGQCTPGLRDCAEGVILPASEILRKRKDAA